MYWGRPYRAFVKPMGIPGWSIITLSDSRGIQALLVEWSAVSLLLVTVYLLAWALVMLAALRMGPSWLWPDARRRSQYRWLAGIYTLLCVLCGVVAFAGDSRQLLWSAALVAGATWVLAAAVLWRRPVTPTDAADRAPQTLKEYMATGTLFLVLSGIVPGAAAVVLAYDLHIESFVKHRQMGLALALRSQVADSGAACQPAAELLLGQLGRYCSFFYGTTAVVRPALRSAVAQRPGPPAVDNHDLLLTILEEYLPYYAESSVEMRELLHQAADDETWTSSRTADGTLALRVAQDLPDDELLVTSVLPSAMMRSRSSPPSNWNTHRC